MAILTKHLRIAVVGSPSSGKSYLLYDMIYAFSHLGYRVQPLPLCYPHSSFGTFFYDTINSLTGGVRGTERYACRPENHYGARFAKRGQLFNYLNVDFLNIPGEVFKDSETFNCFFTLKQALERNGNFWLSTWESPGRHVKKLILPNKEFILKPQHSKCITKNQNTYMDWGGIANELYAGGYREQGKRKRVSGKYVLNHIADLSTDSVLLSIKSKWKEIMARPDGCEDYEDYDASGVFKYFYFFTYCQLATDLVICDRLTETTNVKELEENVCQFMNKSGKRMPKVYLAFRGIDLYMVGTKNLKKYKTIVSKNNTYGEYLNAIVAQLRDAKLVQEFIPLPENIRKRIMQSCGIGIGQGFWKLLNTATHKSYHFIFYLRQRFCNRKTVSELAKIRTNALPPHVYFTATPIDDEFCIYKNDVDPTRFIYEDSQHKKSFIQETCNDMSRHFCFGSLQLLIDILIQNGISLKSNVIRSCNENLQYIQTRLVK